MPTTSGVYSPAIGSRPLPCSLVCRSALRRIWPIACSMKSGVPSSTTSTAFLPAQKRDDLLGHQRMHDVEHQRRQRRRCRRCRSEPASASRPFSTLNRPPCTMMPMSPSAGPSRSLSLLSTMNRRAAGSRRSDLVDLLAEGRRRMAQPVVVEAGGREAVLGRMRGRHVVAWRRSCRTCGRRGCAAPG